jgi:hypothetical protein
LDLRGVLPACTQEEPSPARVLPPIQPEEWLQPEPVRQSGLLVRPKVVRKRIDIHVAQIRLLAAFCVRVVCSTRRVCLGFCWTGGGRAASFPTEFRQEFSRHYRHTVCTPGDARNCETHNQTACTGRCRISDRDPIHTDGWTLGRFTGTDPGPNGESLGEGEEG